MTAAVPPAISSDEYRRHARRLRCLYAGRPDRLQHSLKRLATRTVVSREIATAPTDAPAQVISLPAQVRPIATGVAATFVDHLAREVPTSGLLTYSSRLALLRQAQKLGVRRFEANLLIAAVLERRRQTVGLPAEADSSPRAGSFTSALVAFLIVQGAIALGAWWTLFR